MGKKGEKKGKGKGKERYDHVQKFSIFKNVCFMGGVCVYVCICYIIFIYNPMCVIYM